jgi:hypothetical protein
MNNRCVIVALLAFWLPLQALAGTLAHCEQLTHATGDPEHTTHAADAECHGHAVERHEQDHEHTSGHHCLHCSGTCHGVQSLMSHTDRLFTPFIWPRPAATGIATVQNGYFDTPQRPPRQYS